jgi:hypothetical protein
MKKNDSASVRVGGTGGEHGCVGEGEALPAAAAGVWPIPRSAAVLGWEFGLCQDNLHLLSHYK